MNNFLLNINNISEKILNFEINCAKLANIADVLADKDSPTNIVKAELVAKRIDKSSVSISGTLSLTCQLICGYCLEAVDFFISSNMDIILTRNNKEMADNALYIESDIFNILEIIDEDLLVEIPDNPHHSKCNLDT